MTLRPGMCPGSDQVQTWLKRFPPGRVTCPSCGTTWPLADTAGQSTWALVPQHAPGQP